MGCLRNSCLSVKAEARSCIAEGSALLLVFEVVYFGLLLISQLMSNVSYSSQMVCPLGPPNSIAGYDQGGEITLPEGSIKYINS